ncbi:hypothetical protein B5181_42030, partial [Streptomyces sp. 4F]
SPGTSAAVKHAALPSSWTTSELSGRASRARGSARRLRTVGEAAAVQHVPVGRLGLPLRPVLPRGAVVLRGALVLRGLIDRRALAS